MKKLLSIIMLMNFASMIVCSEDDLNKKLAYETLTDIPNEIVQGIKKGVKVAIKAAIPGYTAACLTNQACKENDSLKLLKIEDRFFLTGMKSAYAILTLIYIYGNNHHPALGIFLGAHAISGIGTALGFRFANKKYQHFRALEDLEYEKRHKEHLEKSYRK